MADFPYKREFITNPQELWENAKVLDLGEFRILDGKLNNRLLPRGVVYKFQGEQVALITDPTAYERINILTDYFAEGPRMQAHVHECPSPLEFFKNNYDTILAKAQQMYVEDPQHTLRYHIREAVYELTKECTTFKITTAKAIFKYFQSKKVLDPSSGWGDRLLGAIAAGVDAYHGVDPNPALAPVYEDIIRFTKPVGDFSVLTEDFLKAELQDGGYDTVFTSPPFFNYEVYTEDERQSIHGLATVDQWTNKFLKPYLSRAWKALAKGGYFILYISDVPTGNYLHHMLEHMKTLRADYLGVIYMASNVLYKGWPIWVWRK